ncbi:SexiOBP11 [Operophtera brumata]|uniref:SexiOBP11 n=1 Tax=Operophtera brumata TaxID=104452 RepID=A0A0L7L5E1_OPEBR|nr:SexiOBP11 [Operophtera brumata]
MCIKDNLISGEDIANLRAKKVPTGPNSGCFLACVMRQIGIVISLIAGEDIANLRAKKVPTGPNSGCFLACVMRQIGIMDDAGLIQKETALELAKSVFDDDEEIKHKLLKKHGGDRACYGYGMAMYAI